MTGFGTFKDASYLETFVKEAEKELERLGISLQSTRNTIREPEETSNTSEDLDELDLALMQSLASYFEKMPNEIRKYHRDHNASREEAEVIANYYLKTADLVKSVRTQQDLEKLLKSVENLKEKVSRYKHESYKYRWSTGLEKEVLEKIKKAMDTHKKQLEN